MLIVSIYSKIFCSLLLFLCLAFSLFCPSVRAESKVIIGSFAAFEPPVKEEKNPV